MAARTVGPGLDRGPHEVRTSRRAARANGPHVDNQIRALAVHMIAKEETRYRITSAGRIRILEAFFIPLRVVITDIL